VASQIGRTGTRRHRHRCTVAADHPGDGRAGSVFGRALVATVLDGERLGRSAAEWPHHDMTTDSLGSSPPWAVDVCGRGAGVRLWAETRRPWRREAGGPV